MAKYYYQVSGIHCSACEVLVERAFRNLSTVEKVKANQAGWVEVWCNDAPNLTAINETLAAYGYRVFDGAKQAGFSWKNWAALCWW